MKKMFDEVKFKNIVVKNRFFRSGTWIAKATEDGKLTDEFFEYYEKVAKAGLGFATVGYARVLEDERANNGMVGMWDDKFIPDLKKLTDMFHENGTPVGIQLATGGSQIHYQGDITWKVLSPSATDVHPRKDDYGNKVVYKSNEITVDEIHEIIEKFADASLRVKKAGFDMVQIHAGHGYFLSQWMNKEINKREDEYNAKDGKFIIDLYEAIRAKVGDDFIVGIKINSEEKVGDKSNYENMINLCKELDKRGIDLIEISGNFPSRTKNIEPKHSYFRDFAENLTKEVNCFTMMTGGNKNFETIESTVNETGLDFIGMSRPLICELDLIEKWRVDSTHQSKCLSCNHCHKVINTCILHK